MIVKILWKSKTFKAVRYNTDKVTKNKGELLKVSGFGALGGLAEVKSQDYINYLSALASRNPRVKNTQFHAMISAKGRSLNKNELVTLAENWLQGMGYGDQPYLLIFHKDTKNNHIHMVSSRVDREGKKISDKFENIRAYRVLNKLIGKDEKAVVEKALVKALRYNFSTRAQFMIILEQQGYALKLKDGAYHLSKFGEKIAELQLSRIDDQILKGSLPPGRKLQLQQIFEKYACITDTIIYPLREKLPGNGFGNVLGYSSSFCENLASSFGLQFIFHFKDEKLPYGYTILDHAGKNVFKGSEIMAISRFMEAGQSLAVVNIVSENFGTGESVLNDLFAPDEQMLLSPNEGGQFHPVDGEVSEGFLIAEFSLDINISDDIDDEQILGRNRRRQRKARTNTR